MFNDKQQEAIDNKKGRVRVIAGAGSGKTSVLTARYAELISEGVKPEEILCVTFTNKAANEMKERIEKKLGISMKNALIKTFHSFCYRLLSEGVSLLGWGKKFRGMDSSDQVTLLKKVYDDLGTIKIVTNIGEEPKPLAKAVNYGKAIEIITKMKVEEEEALDLFIKKDVKVKELYEELKRDVFRSKNHLDLNNKSVVALIKSVLYYGYLYYQIEFSAFDYSDLIIFSVKLLQKDEKFRERWQNRLKYIMVDEFQDASFRQSDLVEILSGKHKNLFVVGDPDQTIYTWRGAKPEILVNFDKEKETKTIIMNQNYRSTPTILNAANKVINNNELRIPKDLFTENKDGEKITFGTFMYNDQAANWVAKKIQSLLGKYKPNDFAILYRNRSFSQAPEKALMKLNIPYSVYSGVNFYEREEIKDMLAYLRVVSDTTDDLSLERIINKPARGLGKAGMDELKEIAKINNCSLYEAVLRVIQTEKSKRAEQLQEFVFLISSLKQRYKDNKITISSMTQEIVDKSGYSAILDKDTEVEDGKREHIGELISAQQEMEVEENYSLEEYLDTMTLMTNVDRKNQKGVSLMTMHTSKGLEFPVVFIFGLNDGVFPSSRSETQEAYEEERRLMYVSITRAKDLLYLIHTKQKYPPEDTKISPFVGEIGKEYLECFEEQPPTTSYRPYTYNRGYSGYNRSYSYRSY